MLKRLLFAALCFAVLPAQGQPSVPLAGRDYIELTNGRPLDPSDGAVVVEEFFNYACPACFSFEPHFVAWAKELPPYVKLQHVPADFLPVFVQYARAYYAAQAFGVAEKTHQAVYDAIHRSRVLPAEGERPDEARIARFYASLGVDADEFRAAMQSFGVESKVRRAAEHMRRNKILWTPSLVINGRYLVRGATIADRLRIASHLIEQEHAGHGARDSVP